MEGIAIYGITKNGAEQGARLKRSLPFADLFVAPVAFNENGEAKPLTLPLADFVAPRFANYDAHIFICAAGIVTRIIAPLIQDKRTDPAVVCVDEQAMFAISMLSGHRGGANQLTQRIAEIIKATPVITTASDVAENVSADMLGARFGWTLDPLSEPAITKVSAAIINDEAVLIAQQAGDKNWWQYEKRMPTNIVCHNTLSDVNSSDYQGAIVISDQRRIEMGAWDNKLVLWRPKSLVLGIGCDRNTPISTLQAGLEAFSQQFNLSLQCVKAMASIDLKADEPGLNQLSQRNQWAFTTFAPQELDNIKGIQSPSDYVKKVTGSNSVAEAAALKLSHSEQLTVPKWCFKKDGFNMTIACCRIAFSESLNRHNRKNWLGDGKREYKPSDGVTFSAMPEVTHNLYGSEVVEGYRCKPKHVDLDRPMLFHTHHLLLCEGARCAKAGSKHLAHDLRTILKEMGLAAGDKRIKISRTLCAGACRNRSTLAIYQRPSKLADGKLINHGIWLRGVEAFSKSTWCELFNALATNQPISNIIESRYFAPFEEVKE
ncbi:cobalamin biosynthesis protein [Thaumasiovibrio sp. DFM-14]|uniref:cobalamin biosynthesis protein n=1 Tax=Thaumasiovibrio sp. DFM-14 TaxID=3384792 RepID=UPI0039A0D49D